MLRANLYLVGRKPSLPVLPFHVVLRLQLAEDRLRVELVDVRVADEADGIDDRRALILGQQRRVLGAHVEIRRDVAQQRDVELFGRRAEVFDVAAVQGIECAVHHRNCAPVLFQLLERDDHDLTSSPFSCSSCSALSKKSTATSGVVFAHSISSEKPSSSETFGAKPSVCRARVMSAVLWRMSNLRPVCVTCGSMELPSSCASIFAISRIVIVSPEPTFTGR